jgi:hypothetical protein
MIDSATLERWVRNAGNEEEAPGNGIAVADSTTKIRSSPSSVGGEETVSTADSGAWPPDEAQSTSWPVTGG